MMLSAVLTHQKNALRSCIERVSAPFATQATAAFAVTVVTPSAGPLAVVPSWSGRGKAQPDHAGHEGPEAQSAGVVDEACILGASFLGYHSRSTSPRVEATTEIPRALSPAGLWYGQMDTAAAEPQNNVSSIRRAEQMGPQHQVCCKVWPLVCLCAWACRSCRPEDVGVRATFVSGPPET